MLVFAAEPYHYLQDAICQHGSLPAGRIESRRFPDGEHYHRVLDTVAAQDAVLIGGTIDDEQTLAVYDVACALVSERAASLTLLVPYFGHSTMDRAVWPGEAVTAKTRARLFSHASYAPATRWCWLLGAQRLPEEAGVTRNPHRNPTRGRS